MTVRPNSIAGGGDAASYYAADNYYTGEQAGPSEWGGGGAEELGLSGTVDAGTFSEVLDGKLPNGAVIARGGNGERAPGFELTFSAPKSVSLVALIGRDERVMPAFAEAIRSTMAWAEERFGEVRSGKAGAVIEPGRLVYAIFHHDLSRKLDPQAHAHVVVANAAQRGDGRWVALHNPALWKHSSTIGAVFHADFRARLEQLGYRTEITGKHGQFEISGIPRAAIDAFSARREQILSRAAELGASGPKAMETIAVSTRDAKQAGDATVARAMWAEKAEVHGAAISAVVDAARGVERPRSVLSTVRAWGAALLERITHAFGPRPEPLLHGTDAVRRSGELASGYAVAAGVRHLGEREASFTYADLLKSSLDLAEKGATVRGIEARIERLREAGVLISGPRGSLHADRLTTRDMLVTEKALVAAAHGGVGQGTPILDAASVDTALDRAADRREVTLSAEQRVAAHAMLSGTNRIQVVQGDAGTGKSFLFELVREIGAEVGARMLVLVPQNKLLDDLTGRGLEVRSLASVLKEHGSRAGPAKPNEQLSALMKGKVVVLEETSMVSSRQLAGLFEVARNGDVAKLVLVGDVKQIPAVEAGRPFALLQEAGAPTVRLTENRRQKTDVLRDAASLAREGRVVAAFERLADKVQESAHPAGAAVVEYLKLLPEERDRTALLTSGHVLREAVLETVRAELLAQGKLGEDAVSLRSWDTLNLTREELRQIRHWAEGMRLDIYRHQSGLVPGSYEVGLIDRASGMLELARDGHTGLFDPKSLRSGGEGAALSVPGEIEVREGDRLVFTVSDLKRGMSNGAAVTLTAIDGDTLHLSGRDRNHVIGPDDPMRERLGHGAVINMHRAQGMTVDRAITVMDSRDRLLNSESLYYVLQTRAREDVSLHTDDKKALASAIEAHRGDVPHASDVAPELSLSGRERFDPATGELPRLDDPGASDRRQLDAMSAALRSIGSEPTKPAPEAIRQAPVPVKELIKEPEIEIDHDYDFDM
ncbi:MULTISPECIES: MobF family relaxase [Sphingomonas]|uniref:MobF family relaxase n=1 Tax=Sphingomonas TaxID=13687 RepID=UPI00254BB2B4|nr:MULTISPECIES: MobF family relaxase [Sphingomonas]MDK8188319.1 MobF family relaxase [Sphingomonas zeae]MDK8217732.1 MobF family relaxase [Sphingomonas sp. UMB7805-LC452B]